MTESRQLDRPYAALAELEEVRDRLWELEARRGALARVLIRANVRRTEIADATGLSLNTIYRWEREL